MNTPEQAWPFSRGHAARKSALRIAAPLIVVVAILLTALPVAAQSHVTYVVQPGDTLSKIARNFCTTWQTIYDMNRAAIGPNPSVITAGTVLTVPNNCGGGGSSGVFDRGPRTHATGTFRAPYYTVAWGDTLTSIGQRFGVSPQAIMNANGLTSSVIQPGQVLIIPGTGTTPPPVPNPPPSGALERVTFAPGAVSATRVGVVEQGMPKRYVLAAMAGQTMQITTRSHGEGLFISVATAGGASVPMSGVNGSLSNTVTGFLPQTTDYIITVTPVVQPESPTLSFDITFTIW